MIDMNAADLVVAALSAVGGGIVALWGMSFRAGAWKSRVEEQLASQGRQVETLMNFVAKTSVLEARLESIAERQQNIEAAINEVRAMLFTMASTSGSTHQQTQQPKR